MGDPDRGRRRALLANLALAAVSLLVALAAAEGLLHVLRPPEPVFIREHPRFGFAHIPGKSGYWQRETDEPVFVQINSKGLRDVERPYAKPAGVVRVMMLGDSFISALNVPFEDTASRVLQRMLRESLDYEGIEVINAGTQAWGTAHELFYLREEGFQYDPDIVVLNFYEGNDFGNNFSANAAPTKPSFALEDGELVFKPAVAPGPILWIRDNILARSAIARTLRRTPLFQGGMARVAARLGLVASDGGQLLGDSENQPPDPERVQEMLGVTRLIITKMAREVRSRGAHFFVHVIPRQRDLVPYYPPELGAFGRPPPNREWFRETMADGLVADLEAHGITVIYPWERIVADTRAGRILYVDGRGHWSAEGNRRSAQDIHEAVLPLVQELLAKRHIARLDPRCASSGSADDC